MKNKSTTNHKVRLEHHSGESNNISYYKKKNIPDGIWRLDPKSYKIIGTLKKNYV
jgi:hypothetical protein